MIDQYEELSKKLGDKCETLFESCFLTHLLDSGAYLKFPLIEAQVKFFEGKKYKYRADFYVETKNGARIIIEIDGNHHYFDSEKRKYDQERTRRLTDSGYRVFRIPNKLVVNNTTDDFEDFLNEVSEL